VIVDLFPTQGLLVVEVYERGSEDVVSKAPQSLRVSFAMSMGPPAEGCCQGDGTTPVAS